MCFGERMLLVSDLNLTPAQVFPLANILVDGGVNNEEQRFRFHGRDNEKFILRRCREVTVEKNNPAGRQACVDESAPFRWRKLVPDWHDCSVGMRVCKVIEQRY